MIVTIKIFTVIWQFGLGIGISRYFLLQMTHVNIPFRKQTLIVISYMLYYSPWNRNNQKLMTGSKFLKG